MIPEAAHAEVERLVRKFKNLSAAERRTYNEAATRQAFILPLFQALEWNTGDAAEVSPEEKVSRGWVDFSFRLTGIPRLFLETKKIAECWPAPHPPYQLLRSGRKGTARRHRGAGGQDAASA